MVDLAKLTVRLEGENAKLTKALAKSSNDLRRFEKTATKAAKGARSALTGVFAGLGAGLGLRALSRSVSQTLDANDKLAKLSTTTGLLVEDLNSLDLALRISGTSLDVGAKGVAKLQRSMFDAVAGLKEASEAFEALDVEIQNSDGTLRDTQEVLLNVADEFSKIEDGAGKAALAQRLFGRSGVQLIPFLNQGSDAISKYRDEQIKLGNTLSGEVAAASERVNDNFTRLAVIQEGVARSFTTGMLPALESVTNAMVDTSDGTNEMSEQFGEFSGNVIRVAVTALLALKAGFDSVGNSIGRFAAAGAAIATGEFSRALDIIQDKTGTFVDEFQQASEAITTVWSDAGADISSTAEGDSDKMAAPLILAEEKAKKAAAGIRKAVKSVEDLAFDEIDREFAAIDKQEAQKLAGTAGPSPGETRAGEIFTQTRTPAENLSTTIRELNDLLNAGDLSFETYSRAMFDAQDEFDNLAEKAEETGDTMSVFAEQAARNIQDDFAEFLFDPFQEDGLNGMLDGFTQTLRKMASEAAAAKIFESIGSAATGSGNSFISGIGSFFSLASRATGGPLAAGQASIVGEREPEVFIPKTAGNIVPISQMAGNITVNVTPPPGRNSQSPSQVGFEIARALNLATRRNG